MIGTAQMQVNLLAQATKRYKENNENILARWAEESLQHFTNIAINTDRLLNSIEEERNTEYQMYSRKNEYRSSWYEYEEEYLDNWER